MDGITLYAIRSEISGYLPLRCRRSAARSEGTGVLGLERCRRTGW